MPEIIVKQGTKVVATHQLSGETIRIGRSRDNDVVLDHLSISRHHTELRREGEHWVAADLDSANGTYVNGQKITHVPLYHADTITVGKIHLHFFEVPQHPPAPPEMRDEECTMVLGSLPSPRACLTVTKGKNNGQEQVIDKDRTVIGRASDCDFPLSDWRISKYHAQVIRRGGEFFIEDLGTWGAIQINGAPTKQAKLTETDEIQLGGTRLAFRLLESEGLQPRQAPIPVPIQKIEPEEEDAPEGNMADPPPEAPPSEVETVDEEGHPPRTSELAETEPPPGWAEEDPVEIEAEAADEPREAEAASPAKGNGTNHGEEEEPAIPEGMEDNREYQMWLRAYQTGGPAMRRHAARQLEKLTGQRYET